MAVMNQDTSGLAECSGGYRALWRFLKTSTNSIEEDNALERFSEIAL